MTPRQFIAFETHSDGNLYQAPWSYRTDPAGHYQVWRQDRLVLAPGPGFELLRMLYCGICATDLHLHQLPFPLPQIGGHEVVAWHQGQPVVVDINAAHWHRGVDSDDCPWCRRGLANHCPSRLTLGIDRLPGGFAPWLLAPRHGIHALPAGLDPRAAVLTEPLAAALRALERTPPRGDEVAVIGAGRLGLLLLAALVATRAWRQDDFGISVVVNRPGRRDLCLALGADQVLEATSSPAPRYSIVYDTSGSAAGLDWALAAATDTVHLKTTAGTPAAGLINPTALVVNELNLAPAAAGAGDPVFSDPVELDRFLLGLGDGCPSPPGPGGTLYLAGSGFADHGVGRAVVQRGLQLHSSRCGDLPAALGFLQEQQQLQTQLLQHYLSADYHAGQLPAAFDRCRHDPDVIKVMVHHDGASN